jgi:hypothetical protein
MSRMVIILILILILTISVAIPCNGQKVTQPAREVIKINLYQEPIRVNCVNYSNSEDWIRDIKVEIQNISRLQIHEIELDIIINNIKDYKDLNGNKLLILISMTAKQKIMPGEKLIIGANAVEYLNYKDTINKADITKVELVLRYASYGNLSGWFEGAEYIRLLRDPNPIPVNRTMVQFCNIDAISSGLI